MFVVELVSLSDSQQLFHTSDRDVLAVHICICMTFCLVYGSTCLYIRGLKRQNRVDTLLLNSMQSHRY